MPYNRCCILIFIFFIALIQNLMDLGVCASQALDPALDPTGEGEIISSDAPNNFINNVSFSSVGDLFDVEGARSNIYYIYAIVNFNDNIQKDAVVKFKFFYPQFQNESSRQKIDSPPPIEYESNQQLVYVFVPTNYTPYIGMATTKIIVQQEASIDEIEVRGPWIGVNYEPINTQSYEVGKLDLDDETYTVNITAWNEMYFDLGFKSKNERVGRAHYLDDFQLYNKPPNNIKITWEIEQTIRADEKIYAIDELRDVVPVPAPG